ncbi:MAG: chromosomal replication initiator protein DnaA [Patescibacteria group bacterium]|nr:chromosomal replication initiator protein DnaA [Patescibacteria group bacterium]
MAQTQISVSRASFATWFKNTKITENKCGGVTVAAPNSFSKEWLDSKYRALILKILRTADPNIRLVDFVVDSTTEAQPKQKTADALPEELFEPQMQFEEFKIDQKTNLNPHYTFDNFVVGGFNELAHAAGMAVADSPGAVYNPLFVYGGVGVGKTHLLQAVGNKIARSFPQKNISYTTAERFISKIVEAIRNQEIENLKRKMGQLDVIIIDDIQFFSGKDKTQEEFFHIYNVLHQNRKQIILSSDRAPGAIPAIMERLKSRFEGGMVADINSPDIETRMAILKTKSEEMSIKLAADVLEFVASNIQRNIRELEGALNRLAMYYKINKISPDLIITKKILKNIIAPPKKTTNAKKIIQAVASFFDLNQNDILLTTRRKEIVKPRQIAMYLLRQEVGESYPSIGRKFQGKDHTTAMYAFEKIAKQLEEDDSLLNEVNLIKQRLYNEV